MVCQNILRGILFAWGLFVPILAFAQEPLENIPIEAVQLLKISGSDERAVIKTPDGKLVVIKVGDAIGNQKGKITEIAAGRVVVEEKVGREIETVIFRLEGGRQRIERIKRFGEERPMMLAPQQGAGIGGAESGTGGSFTKERSGK
jgi:hypothetical protein